MIAKLTICGILGLLVISGLPNMATAAGPYYYGGYYGAVTPWDYSGRTYERISRNIPYFALHPPVYYSRPVPRTYGYSPFALFPGMIPPQSEVGSWLSAPSPYTLQMSAGAMNSYQAVSKPLRIVNPYVAKPGDPGVSPEAVMPGLPKVIRPVSVATLSR